jgi:hypothetical protein
MKVILTILWVLGIVVAHGFWQTFFAVIIPLYSWYLIIEHIVVKYNLL